MPKIFTLTFQNKPVIFLVPDIFDSKSIIKNIPGIRIGTYNWERPFLGLDIEVSNVESVKITGKMKYIVVSKENDKAMSDHSYMFIFNKVIDHDRMYEVIQHMVYETEFPKDMTPDHVFSAGFIYEGGLCGGSSETLGVTSHPDDGKIFKKHFITDLLNQPLCPKITIDELKV